MEAGGGWTASARQALEVSDTKAFASSRVPQMGDLNAAVVCFVLFLNPV